MEPLWPAEQLHVAYQLNWSLSVRSVRLPDPSQWFTALQDAVEPDGVRLLEHSWDESEQHHQFLVSTKPHVRPSEIPRSVKGRLQYLLRAVAPRIFQRNYSLQSVGEANDKTLHSYVSGQPLRHRMADERVQEMIERLQFEDSRVDLRRTRTGKHARFLSNLHLVFETSEHYHETCEEALRATREMIIGAARKHQHLLSQIGLVSNHFHILLGSGLHEDPLSIGASYLNNISYAHGMKQVLEPSFFVGTFGPYNRDAIRRRFQVGWG